MTFNLVTSKCYQFISVSTCTKIVHLDEIPQAGYQLSRSETFVTQARKDDTKHNASIACNGDTGMKTMDYDESKGRRTSLSCARPAAEG